MSPRSTRFTAPLVAVAGTAAAFSFSLALALALALAAPPALAQATGEEVLRDRFEGTFVRVKMDLPAHQKGVDVYPQERPNLDYSELGKRIKRYGVGVRRGEEIQVTKVKLKKDLIEFQLGGGGYGTFGDDTGDVSVPTAAKTRREKNLEEDLKRTTDPARRRQIQEEIDDLRREREREDAHNQAIAAEASEVKKEAIRARAAESGSRFNVRFRGPVPASALEVAGLMDALDEFVVFDVGDHDPDHDADGGVVMDAPVETPPVSGVAALRKGMTRAEAEAVLGAPTKVTPGKEGTLKVERLVFTTEGERIEALIVEGVLVRYAVTSK
jgi:hypothetical protein